MASPSPAHSSVSLHVSRKALFALIGGIAGPWILLAVYWFNFRVQPQPHIEPVATTVATDTAYTHCKPGPWGDLEYVRILTEPPEQQVVANFPAVGFITWTFRGYTPEKINALWKTAKLSAAELATINQPDIRTVEGDVTRIQAPRDFILNLTPEARNVIYSALSLFPENPAQAEPFRFRSHGEDEWFRDSGLSPETIAQVKRLLYRRGTSVLFSDHALLIPTIKSLEERTRLIKTLSRKSTLMVRLCIGPDTDIDEIEDYWRAPGSKDIAPLLSSLKRLQGNVTVDIVHLLPRFVRARLYSYPSINDPGSMTYMDCHWTVLNFFNNVPDPKYENIDRLAEAFRINYHPVTGKPRYGDIYLFTLPNGDVIHSCVYIADDIVFTKNGATPSSPWILMNFADVVAFYPSEQPLDIQRYRPKFMSSD